MWFYLIELHVYFSAIMLQKYNASASVSLFLLFAPNIWNSTDRHEALFFLEAIPDNGSPFKVAIGKKKDDTKSPDKTTE